MSTEMGPWGHDDQTEAKPVDESPIGFVVVEDDALDRAQGAFERAETRVRTEARRLAAAQKAVEDAAGALELAKIRKEEHEAGVLEADQGGSKSAALAEAVSRAERRLLAAEDAIADRQAELDTARAAAGRAGRSLDRKRDAATEAALQLAAEPAEPELIYSNVAEFVTDYLLPLYRRRPTVWCAQWWDHPEALVRLQALWLSWERLRLDPFIGLSSWLRDHLDHHMPVLLSNDGPLKGCKGDSHAGGREVLPSSPPPAGTFQDERTGHP